MAIGESSVPCAGPGWGNWRCNYMDSAIWPMGVRDCQLSISAYLPLSLTLEAV
jgi:hypothetical protein